jgi:predicted dehydrogenase
MIRTDIRWGIIGAGDVAHAFVNDFKWMKQAKLQAIACSDSGRGEAFAKKYDIPYALTYEELYKHKEIDAVYIATIHHLHFDQALNCLNAGKAVLCEKPITINDMQFKELAAVSKERHVFLMEAMWTYFLPAVIKAKQWIDDGLIGEIKVIQADLAYPMNPVTQAKLFDPAIAGGSLLKLGIYPIALAYYLTEKEPEHVISSAQLTKSGVDERLAMTLQYGDLTASLFSSIVTRMTNTGRIFGEKGYIEIPDFFRAHESKLFDQEYNLVESFQDRRVSHGFIFEMQHSNDLILAGAYESPVMPHARSYSIQKTMTTIRKQAGMKFPMED